MPSRPFGKYEVVARLATGGAASIFLARERRDQGTRLVVIKTLLPERARDAEFVAMFLDEARLARELTHPNCVQMYDLGQVRGVYYIAMEYIFGETLWNFLATVAELRTPLPAPVVAAMLAAAGEGLHHAHELKDPNGRPYNLVHRDVSPQNIMVTFDGTTKVLDFGVAKAETGRQATATGIVKGKFSYMSPEQITGGSVDRRSDIFSLGIVMFECLASRRLYRADTPEEIASLMLERRPPRLSDIIGDIHPSLDEICARALARHPQSRFETAHTFAAALFKYLDDVGLNDDQAAIARLANDRFSKQIRQRQRVLDQVREGRYDEAEVMSVFGARAVFEVDLFPDQDSGGVAMMQPAKLPFTPADASGNEDRTYDEGDVPEEPNPAWRVEIQSVGPDPLQPVGIKVPGRMTDDAVESEAATRFEADATQFESKDPRRRRGRSPSESDTVGLQPVSQTAEIAPNVMLAEAIERAGSIPTDEQSQPDLDLTNDALDQPTMPRRDPSETIDEVPPMPVASDPTRSVPAGANPRPVSSRPAVEVVRGRVPARTVSDTQPDLSKPRSSHPLPPIAPEDYRREATATVGASGTYTLGVVLSAFAFGVALGLLVGVLLAWSI